MKRTIFILPLVLFLLQCSDSPEPLEVPQQDILFKYEYRNYAWGEVQKGWLLDSAGFILKFENPSVWNDPDANGQISLAGMNENLGLTTPFNIQLSKTSLNELAGSINRAVQGELGSSQNVGADMGTVTLSAYTFDQTTFMYKEYVLQQEGDNRREHSSDIARKLAIALKNIQRELEE